jgi:hypothetical protein
VAIYEWAVSFTVVTTLGTLGAASEAAAQSTIAASVTSPALTANIQTSVGVAVVVDAGTVTTVIIKPTYFPTPRPSISPVTDSRPGSGSTANLPPAAIAAGAAAIIICGAVAVAIACHRKNKPARDPKDEKGGVAVQSINPQSALELGSVSGSKFTDTDASGLGPPLGSKLCIM